MTIAELQLALPEIALLSMACVVLLADLFIPDKRRGLTHILALIALAVPAVLTLGTMMAPGEIAFAFSETFVRDRFGDVLKLRNDHLGAEWDAENDALALTLSGSLWITPFMCADGNATACADQDAVAFSDLRIDTRGNMTLGGGAVNLLAARQEPLAVIGDNPSPTLGIDVLALRKPADANTIMLDIGGELNLPDLASRARSSSR